MKNPLLVYQAKSFYNAYLALEQLATDEDELILLIPKLVNGAFSAELSIKAILAEQNIPYNKEHNLKILFDKLPLDIRNRIWEYISGKVPEYSAEKKREEELLLISDAFVQWRYAFESIAPAFDLRFLSIFTNSLIYVMFSLGYNGKFVEITESISLDEYQEIENMFENNRIEFINKTQEKIKKRLGNNI